MPGRCLGDLVFRIRQFFQFIQVVIKDISDRGIGWFLGAQGPLASEFEPFGGVFFSQSQQAQAGVVGLLLEDFCAQDAFTYRCAGRADSPGLPEEVFGGVAFYFGIMLMIGWPVFGHGGISIWPNIAFVEGNPGVSVVYFKRMTGVNNLYGLANVFKRDAVKMPVTAHLYMIVALNFVHGAVLDLEGRSR